MDKGVALNMLNKQAGYGSTPKLYSINWTYYLLFKKKKEEEDLKLRGNESGE